MRLIKLLKFSGTRNLLDLYINYFCHTFVRFCQENELSAKALLLLDNAPDHPTKLAGVRNGSIIYLPSNTTSICNQWTTG
jgi:hypothetical protein